MLPLLGAASPTLFVSAPPTPLCFLDCSLLDKHYRILALFPRTELYLRRDKRDISLCEIFFSRCTSHMIRFPTPPCLRFFAAFFFASKTDMDVRCPPFFAQRANPRPDSLGISNLDAISLPRSLWMSNYPPWTTSFLISGLVRASPFREINSMSRGCSIALCFFGIITSASALRSSTPVFAFVHLLHPTQLGDPQPDPGSASPGVVTPASLYSPPRLVAPDLRLFSSLTTDLCSFSKFPFRRPPV